MTRSQEAEPTIQQLSLQRLMQNNAADSALIFCRVWNHA